VKRNARRCQACERYLYRYEQLVCRQCRRRIKGYVEWAAAVVRAEMSVCNDGVTIGVAPSPAVQSARGGITRTLTRTAGRTLNT
jgi:hypothetical protein